MGKNEQKKNKRKFKIGVAFGGGASRGFAHLGALKALEENGIEFDEVAGTSVGSLVGALYASGLKIDQIINIAKNLSIKDLKINRIPFKRSKTDGIEDIIISSIGDLRFEDLKKPFTAIAVDLLTGKEVLLNSGSVAKAVAGSCALPYLYYPVDFGPYRLIDGGARNNIPADVLKNKDCKYVIAIDVNPTRGRGTTNLDYISVLTASADIAMAGNALRGELFADILIKIDLKKFKATKLDGAEEMIKIGYDETIKMMPEIKKMLNMEEKKSWIFRLFKRTSKILKDQKEEQEETKSL